MIAATLWKLADRVVDDLSREGFTIDGPARALTIIAELLAFGLHAADRMAHVRLSEAGRAALVQAVGMRLAGILEENGLDGRAQFFALLNRRGEDYASFEFPEGGASYPALRYLAQQIREAMATQDQQWVMDQVMDVEAPGVLSGLSRTIDGLLARHT